MPGSQSPILVTWGDDIVVSGRRRYHDGRRSPEPDSWKPSTSCPPVKNPAGSGVDRAIATLERPDVRSLTAAGLPVEQVSRCWSRLSHCSLAAVAHGAV